MALKSAVLRSEDGSDAAASIAKAIQVKDRENVDDETLIKADIAEKAIRQLEELIAELTADKIGEEKAKELA
ncbi:hypothetical protein DRO22_04035, partial [Candidatus Bathyarchaeota archaeon]